VTPERWQTVTRLFHEALDEAPEGRATFLDRACGGDATLRTEVETLLSSGREAGAFLETPAASRVSLPAEGDAMVGRRIGSYRVLREIGHGGMGAVFLAVRDDDAYRKQVAIKVVRAWGTSDVLVERFRQERHILAALDHPNVGRLLDGGTTEEGLPYLVMEYVEGVPIDEYCEAHALPLGERLALFRTVCSAVQFAHQNLVVHRDIKPANILIAADGTPKLLDFGIAKLLSPELASRGQTATAFPMMTPDYASPEQVRNEPISTASDVYSLGVLLYRLLTGRGPYRVPTGSMLEVVEAVRDQEPERPSAIVRRLAGDLDNIVLRALRKEPRERYASVEEFSADVGRHLSGQPVVARKATVAYRSGKFIRRHKVGVSAAALVFASLVGGIVSTVREARISRAERARAERRFNDVRKLANSFLFEVHDAIERLPGSTPARELVVKRALEYLDNLAQEAAGDTSLQRELAAAYERVGDVQGRVFEANLGNTAGARASHAKALAMREALVAAEPKNLEFRRDLSSSYYKIGEGLFSTGNPKGAAEMLGKAVLIDQALATEEPSSRKARDRLAGNYSLFGYMLGASGDAQGGLENSRKGLALLNDLAASAPADAKIQSRLSIAYMHLGDILTGVASDDPGAVEAYRKALTIERPLVAAEPRNTHFRHNLMVGLTMLGDVQMKMGEPVPALAGFREALAALAPLSAADPANAQYSSDVALLEERIGTVQAELGQADEALPVLRKALAVHESELASDPSNVLPRARVANSAGGLGKVHSVLAARAKSPAERVRSWREARGWYQKAHDLWLGLRTQGATTGTEAAKPDELAGEIARCDEALAKLSGAALVTNAPR
jgi:non-specific serine/threonine protein kinase/serine/threonine-protein kinase